jgi:hypothetical protein
MRGRFTMGTCPSARPKEARMETTNAISYASTHHGDWFWAGVDR